MRACNLLVSDGGVAEGGVSSNEAVMGQINRVGAEAVGKPGQGRQIQLGARLQIGRSHLPPGTTPHPPTAGGGGSSQAQAKAERRVHPLAVRVGPPAGSDGRSSRPLTAQRRRRFRKARARWSRVGAAAVRPSGRRSSPPLRFCPPSFPPCLDTCETSRRPIRAALLWRAHQLPLFCDVRASVTCETCPPSSVT